MLSASHPEGDLLGQGAVLGPRGEFLHQSVHLLAAVQAVAVARGHGPPVGVDFLGPLYPQLLRVGRLQPVGDALCVGRIRSHAPAPEPDCGGLRDLAQLLRRGPASGLDVAGDLAESLPTAGVDGQGAGGGGPGGRRGRGGRRRLRRRGLAGFAPATCRKSADRGRGGRRRQKQQEIRPGVPSGSVVRCAAGILRLSFALRSSFARAVACGFVSWEISAPGNFVLGE